MEQREMLVTLISAQNLKKVNAFGKMTAYCVAWIYPNQKVSSPMDKKGNLNPTWNVTLKLTADERHVQDGNAVLVIDLYDHGTFGNTNVGSCTIPLSWLKVPSKAAEEKSVEKPSSTEGSSSSSANVMAVPVLRKSGKAKGTLNVSVKLGELIKYPAAPMGGAASDYMVGQPMPGSAYKSAPVYAYPAAGYPPAYGPPGYAQPGAAQPYPVYQQAPYPGGMPPPYYPPGGYAPQPPPRRSGMGGGMGGGLGAGLVGGALGGLLLGSMLGGDGGDGGGCGGGGCGGGGCGG